MSGPEKKRRVSTKGRNHPLELHDTLCLCLSFLDLWSWATVSRASKTWLKAVKDKPSSLSLRLRVTGCLYGIKIEPRCDWPKALRLLNEAEATGSEWRAEILYLRSIITIGLVQGLDCRGAVAVQASMRMTKEAADLGHSVAQAITLKQSQTAALQAAAAALLASGDVTFPHLIKKGVQGNPAWNDGVKYIERLRRLGHPSLVMVMESAAVAFPSVLLQLADRERSFTLDIPGLLKLIDLGMPHASYLLATRGEFRHEYWPERTNRSIYLALLQAAAEQGHWFAGFELTTALLRDEKIDKKTAYSWAIKSASYGCRHSAALFCHAPAADTGLSPEDAKKYHALHGDWANDEEFLRAEMPPLFCNVLIDTAVRYNDAGQGMPGALSAAIARAIGL